ncbi:MAG TPA: DUF167 family protein [Spongiibacteraceae bacterium]|nr:DUF167 family protein [Spongiibacteraceae bacterium]
MSTEYYQWRGADLLLFCQLQPQASRDEFVGAVAGATAPGDRHGTRLKIRIAAPPVDGKANAHLIAFLAAEFNVTRRAVSIVGGELGRQKTVLIEQPQRLPGALSIAPPPTTL